MEGGPIYKSKPSQLTRIRISVRTYLHSPRQHDNHLYTWRAWMFSREFRFKPKRKK